MNTLVILWHELVLRHGAIWVEFGKSNTSRRHGVVVECPCGKRWLARAPWFRSGGAR